MEIDAAGEEKEESGKEAGLGHAPFLRGLSVNDVWLSGAGGGRRLSELSGSLSSGSGGRRFRRLFGIGRRGGARSEQGSRQGGAGKLARPLGLQVQKSRAARYAERAAANV